MRRLGPGASFGLSVFNFCAVLVPKLRMKDGRRGTLYLLHLLHLEHLHRGLDAALRGRLPVV